MRPKSAFFHFIIIAAIAGAVLLGVWQLQRREWKHELISYMSAHLAMPPEFLGGHVTDNFIWRPIEVRGWVDYAHALIVPYYAHEMPCVSNGVHGVIVFAPLRLQDGTDVLFRAGWFPGDEFKNVRRAPMRTTGIIRPFDPPSWIKPYDKHSNLWLRAAPEMYDALHLARLNYYVDNAGDNTKCNFPLAMWHKPELPDNHLQYAITWFALAAVLSALYIYLIWTQRKTIIKTSPGRN